LSTTPSPPSPTPKQPSKVPKKSPRKQPSPISLSDDEDLGHTSPPEVIETGAKSPQPKIVSSNITETLTRDNSVDEAVSCLEAMRGTKRKRQSPQKVIDDLDYQTTEEEDGATRDDSGAPTEGLREPGHQSGNISLCPPVPSKHPLPKKVHQHSESELSSLVGQSHNICAQDDQLPAPDATITNKLHRL
jgi:hypothetical protein